MPVHYDALADVHATIALARLIFQKQPRLFKFLFDHRKKDKAIILLNLYTRAPFLHTAGYYTRPEGCTTALSPLAVDPGNRNNIIAFDLRYDPRPLLDLSVEKIRERVFTPEAELTEERIMLRTVSVNKCPALSPLKALDDASARRLKLNREEIHERWKLLTQDDHLTEKIRAVYDKPRQYSEPQDPDLAIYSGGFFSDADKRLFDTLVAAEPEQWRMMKRDFDDPRAAELFRRLVGRNFPELMKTEEQQAWKNFCATRLLFPPAGQIDDFGTYEKKLDMLSRSSDLSPAQKGIIRKLTDYKNRLKETILAYHGV